MSKAPSLAETLMGNMVNKKWQNAIGFSIIAFLMLMNGLYGLSVALPSVFSHLVGPL